MKSEVKDRSVRQIRAMPGEFTVREQGDDLFIEGYFAVFNTLYELWEGAAETVLHGAFADTLNDDVRALINHSTRLVLGRNKAGTLELREDAKGLWGRIKINRSDSDAMNLYARVQRGDVNQCSFGFDIVAEEHEENTITGLVLWKLKKVRLHEVSVVTFPAYEETSVSARQKDFDEIQKRKAQLWKETTIKRLKGEQ